MLRPLALTACTVLLLGGCATTGGSHSPSTTPQKAEQGLASLKVAVERNGSTYEREKFGTPWKDVDGNGCDTRNDVLARDLTSVQKKDGCIVLSGVLEDDPYSGQRISFTRTHATQIQIDHVFPLALAWRLGADQWAETKRTQFANDPANLLAVSGRPNQQKGDSGPGEWQPPAAFQCTYAKLFIAVAQKYDLPVTKADHNALETFLGTC